jgi:hypothetical protein
MTVRKDGGLARPKSPNIDSDDHVVLSVGCEFMDEKENWVCPVLMEASRRGPGFVSGYRVGTVPIANVKEQRFSRASLLKLRVFTDQQRSEAWLALAELIERAAILVCIHDAEAGLRPLH